MVIHFPLGFQLSQHDQGKTLNNSWKSLSWKFPLTSTLSWDKSSPIHPSLKFYFWNLPNSGRHRTNPDEGLLISFARKKRKKRDPGNEVQNFCACLMTKLWLEESFWFAHLGQSFLTTKQLHLAFIKQFSTMKLFFCLTPTLPLSTMKFNPHLLISAKSKVQLLWHDIFIPTD